MLKKIDDDEEVSWGRQFVNACMLHPQKNDEGELEEITGMDGFYHFILIGWKVFYAIIPPAHYGGGWPCFVISLAFIGITTAVVGQFADMFGCVIGLKNTVTAITFVALGTSLPDTFASMSAAAAETYADAAIGNVTGSNSVNVFLGLGLPWIIGAAYENATNGRGYFVPAKALGFSVVIFLICGVTCIIFLMVRRCVVGGELGGETAAGRTGSALFLCSLWMLYIILSSLQAYSIGGLEKLTFGIDQTVVNPNPKCNY